MKMFIPLSLLLVVASNLNAQQKNFIDQPYIEVKGSSDTLITPDRIYIDILIAEEDTKGRKNVEDQERKMISEFEKLNIDIEKQLFVADASSDFKSYFLSGQKVLKSKTYQLLVYEASTLGNVMNTLQDIGISNVNLNRTEHSKIDTLKTMMKSKAVSNAKDNAEAMSAGINQKIGKAIYVSESNSFSYAYKKTNRSYQIKASSSMEEEKTAPDLSFNQLEIGSNVIVRFILE